MNHSNSPEEHFQPYYVWDRSVRIFHWVNFICVIGLICLGLILLNGKSFGLSSDGKVLLKTLHVYFGYVLVFNLAWRIVWGFLGNSYSKWKTILPFRKGYIDSLSSYTSGLKNNNSPHYAGHNPLGTLMVSLLFALLISQATTGLVVAGTDLYMPPFGQKMAEWVAADPNKVSALKPGSKEGVNPDSYKEMRAFRKPYITVHKYGFYILAIAILLHLIGVVVTEVREKSGLVSAMFTGYKVFSKKPVDHDGRER